MPTRIISRSLLFPAILCLATAGAQPLTPMVVTPLGTALNETSGLLMLEGHAWTQLDSGNPNALYELDPATGEVLRTVTIANASNVDWEDLASDSSWVYIGDFGNNAGSRTDLRVYRVSRAALLDTGTTTLQADTIAFSYADQTDFTPANNANDRDCEAMIAMDDSLFLFTKNWVSQTTYLYVLPAQPGVWSAQRRDTLDAQGLVTGAALDGSTGTVALIGYSTILSPFLWQLAGYSGHDLFGGSAERHPLVAAFTQMEGIDWSAPGTVSLTNEQFSLSPARLWELEVDLSTTVPDVAAAQLVFQPCAGGFTVTAPHPGLVRCFDGMGRVVFRQRVDEGQAFISTASLAPGAYLLRMEGEGAVRFVVGR